MLKQRLPVVQCEPLKVTPICRKTRKYATREEAEREIWRLVRKNRRAKKNRGWINAYYCSTCACFHLGHTTPDWVKKQFRSWRKR